MIPLFQKRRLGLRNTTRDRRSNLQEKVIKYFLIGTNGVEVGFLTILGAEKVKEEKEKQNRQNKVFGVEYYIIEGAKRRAIDDD